jgi:hypothetical protein
VAALARHRTRRRRVRDCRRSAAQVGKGLIDETRRLLGPRVSLILASMPDSVGFYERIGMPRQPDAFWFKRSE